jgi:hypothetical protein
MLLVQFLFMVGSTEFVDLSVLQLKGSIYRQYEEFLLHDQ